MYVFDNLSEAIHHLRQFEGLSCAEVRELLDDGEIRIVADIDQDLACEVHP